MGSVECKLEDLIARNAFEELGREKQTEIQRSVFTLQKKFYPTHKTSEKVQLMRL